MGAYTGFVFDDPLIWITLSLEGPYIQYVIFPVYFSSSVQVTVLINFTLTYFIPHYLQKVQTVGLAGGSIEGEGIIPCLYVGNHVITEVGYIVWRGLGFFLWWSSLAAKLAVSVIMYLAADMATDVKGKKRPNNFVMTFPIFYFY